MAEPSKQYAAGDEIKASDLAGNFTEVLNNYRDFTYGETIAVNETLYLKASDGKVYKTDADFNDERIHNFIGFAKEAGDADDVKKVQIGGKVSGLSGLTVGVDYYLSGTAGAISATSGNNSKKIGLAVSSTELLISARDVTFSANGNFQKDISVTTTTTIAHGLGRIPVMVRFTWFINASASNQAPVIGIGVYNGITQSYVVFTPAAPQLGDPTVIAGYVLVLADIAGGLGKYLGGAVTLDGTNITITWTKVSTPAGTAFVMWEAF